MLDRKHIKAPATFDPGKGHPRERLIYANDAEMEMLRVLTDGTISRGPRGIPSFAVTSGKETGTTMGGGNRTSSNPSGGGPGGPLGPNSGPSRSPSAPASGVGGGSKGTSQNSSPKSPSGPSGPNSGASAGKPAGGVSPSGPSTPSGGSKSPSSPSSGAMKSPSNPMGGQGSSFGSSAAAASFNRGAINRSQPTPASPMGGQQSSFSRPSAAAEANRRTASAINGGLNPSGSMRTPSALSGSQIDAYKTFGRNMAAAPRQPEITRTPGDAEQLARMARAENGLIRDPVTGQMSQLAAQGTMNVIRNRAENQGVDVEGIISQSGQFSPWKDGSYAATAPSAAEVAMAEQVLRGMTPDYTATPARPQGADYYHNETTVKNKSGYSNAATKGRVKDRFEATMSVADAVKPGVYGHTYGYDPTGMPASRFRTTPMGPAPAGRTDYGTGRVPTAANVPQGALSPDPNYGGFVGSAPAAPRSGTAPGRFGGARPDFGGGVAKISADGTPVEDYGTIGMGFNVPRSVGYNSRFGDQLNEYGQLRDIQNPNQFSTERLRDGFYSDRVGPGGTSTPMNNWSNGFDPNRLSPDGQRLYDAMSDTSLRTGVPRDFFSGRAGRSSTPNHPAGNAIDIRVMDPATTRPVGNEYNPIRLSGSTRAAYDNAADDVLDTMYQNPDMYGGLAPRTRYGGDFRTSTPYDQMHMDVTPGGGFSAEQSQRHAAAVGRSGNVPGTGGYMTASATSPGIMNSAPQEPSYQLSEGGIYNTLRAAPGAISGLLSGLNTQPVRDVLSNPMVKTYAEAITGSPFKRTVAEQGFKMAVGPAVKKAASDAISGIKNIANPNNPRAQEAERERKASSGSPKTNTAAGVRETQNAEQQRGTSSPSAPSRSKGNPDRGKGGDREGKETAAQKAKRIGKKKIEDLAKPEPKAVDWSNYTNVMSKEQAMRKLLGEEWYA